MPWYQYGLSPTNTVRLTYVEEPTTEDLELLVEFIKLHLRGARQDAARRTRDGGAGAGEGE